MNENESSQFDEIQVLQSMYTTEELKPRTGMDRCWLIPINVNNNIDDDETTGLLDCLVFEFWFHRNYPSESEPFFELKGAKNWINLPYNQFKNNDYFAQSGLDELDKITIKEALQMELKAMFSLGVPIAFTWIEFLRNDLSNMLDVNEIYNHVKLNQKVVSIQPNSRKSNEDKISTRVLDIIHGESFTEKKSKFVGHVAIVKSLEDVNLMLSQLLEDDKVANATHNIYAYRIRQGDQILENRDDDGETGAADQILYLMQISNAENVCCVVTRWYGGIKLGADRFRVSSSFLIVY